MASYKARFFNDTTREALILSSSSPREHKSHGRKVANFDDRRWDAVKFDVVVRGNLAKFSQNKEMMSVLLESGEKVLAEASPRDCVWGIGLGSGHPDARDMSKWRGSNLLGKALMRVRQILREKEEEERIEDGQQQEQEQDGGSIDDRRLAQGQGRGQGRKKKQKQNKKQKQEQPEGEGSARKKSKKGRQ